MVSNRAVDINGSTDTLKSSFTALNVVYEDESEEEIDDSKELQIEEALKLYQNALKLHSQGPAFYDEAEAAYKELLSSEVFSYAESLSESRWLELYGDVDPVEDGDDEDVVELPTAVAGGEGVPSTLPQVLYLAYKNHGQFRLDRLREQLSRIEQGLRTNGLRDSGDSITEAASTGLQHLAEALDRDESDLELWRKVARVGDFLGSRRIARFCLETVIDGDGDDPSTTLEPLNLEQAFAHEQFLPMLASIGDRVAEHQLQSLPKTQQSLIKSLRKHIDPFPYLPAPHPSRMANVVSFAAIDQEIEVHKRTWASCGAAILSRQNAESLHRGQKGAIQSESGARYFLSLPPKGLSELEELSSNNGLLNGDDVDQPTSAVLEINGAKHAGEVESLNAAAEAEMLESPTKIDKDGSNPSPASPISTPHSADPQAEPTPLSAGLEEQPDIEQTEGTNVGVMEPLTRKRSSETAELAEGADIGRSRSKRIKARGSIADPAALKDTTAEDWAKWYKQQLSIYVRADNAAFQAAGKLLSRFGCNILEDPVEDDQMIAPLEDELVPQEPLQNRSVQPTNAPALDIRALLDEWDLAKSRLFLHGDISQTSANGPVGLSSAGFSAFLTQSTESDSSAKRVPAFSDDIGLDEFVKHVHEQPWNSLDQLAFQWIQQLLEHQSLGSGDISGPYETSLWPEDLKKTVVLLLVNQDGFIYDELSRCIDELNHPAFATPDPKLSQTDVARSEERSVALVQTIFELHLDVYSRITNPSSTVDQATRALQRDRLSRWAALASTAMNESSWSFSEQDTVQPGSWQLMYRFLWASVVCNNLLEPSTSEVTVAYFQHLIQQLRKDSEDSERIPKVIYLPNNAAMPEISVDAAEKEVSRLTTLDFFASIFSSNDEDPVLVIEKLEPLLLLSVNGEARRCHTGLPDHEAQSNDEETVNATSHQEEPTIARDPRLLEALQFLNRASLSMRLILWQRLQDAYSIVNYPPQILACNLWSLIIILRHIQSSSYLETNSSNRQENLLRWLHRLDELITQILALASTNSSAFECVDHAHLTSSMEAVAGLSRIVHIFGVWEDTIRVGQTQPTPQPSNAASRAQLKSAEKFREMMVKTWTLQYVLIKEAIVQNQDVHITNDELMKYLRLAHNALGLRTYCGLANKMFLKLAKSELMQMKASHGWDSEMPQVIFDLYGLKISSTPADMQDHSCEPMDLDRSTALDVLDLVLLQVDRLSIKDLLKNDLRFAVDKMQGVIRVPTAVKGSARSFNKRLLTAYLKSPISPVDLFRSIRGIGELCSTTIRSEGWTVAAKRWYFLLGNIALTKFRSQKRITAGSMEDLDNAKAFFKLDLEFDTERWETWYRLAQTFDTQIDEYTTWTADKLENDKDGLIDLQRQAILCYTMAVAAAKRCEQTGLDDANKMASLYADFGIRLYASTREPFNAKAFGLDDFKKQFNGSTRGMYEDLPFKPLPIYTAWKLASSLLGQAAKQKSDDWYISYMLGKVLWKMYIYCPDPHNPPVNRLGSQPAIDAIVHAVKCVPEKRDSRHPEKDPILEPHYKLVSMLHKLLRSKRPDSSMSVERACHILKATPYARKVPDVQDPEDWEQYILAVLKSLRSADKSNWHHRMVVRAAHIIYDENREIVLAVLGAKHELSQQIFTKTMTIQVWKPDNERAGRHFVYTGRYVLFFAELLLKTNDRDNMDMLARRIRRKAGDFANHTRIWIEYSLKYLELLRNTIPVPVNYNELIFNPISPEEFSVSAARLEAWVLAPGTVCQHMDILRDAMEYKKLNNNLMDKTAIEDLIADVYAWIYNRNVDELKAKETAEENRVRMSVINILMNPTPVPSNASGASVEPAGGEQGGRGVRRNFSITRRMIIVKAEALIVKPPAIATPKPAQRTLAPAPIPGQSPALAVVIPQMNATAGEIISVPGSVHDSADDESELSDVEDLIEDPDLPPRPAKKSPMKPFFPNLLGARADAEDVESTAGDEGEAVEDDGELEFDAEEPPAPGHVATGGFASSGPPDADPGGDRMEMQERAPEL